MYSQFAPYFVRSLHALSAILTKAEAHCTEKKIPESRLVNDFLAADMFDFKRQVQQTCDHAVRSTARLAGVDIPSFPDTETSFAELRARIASAISYLEGFKPEQFADAAVRDVTLKLPTRELTFKGDVYLSGFAIPNFYFHMTTAYNILRQNGVGIGKFDFMGA